MLRVLNHFLALWLAMIAVFTSAVFLCLYFGTSDREQIAIYGGMGLVSAAATFWMSRHAGGLSDRRLALLHLVIRACLAHVVLWYGLAKLFPGGQFGRPPLLDAERPYYELPPFWRAFAFFGYSPLYNAAMAAGETVSAVLIYFDRTLRLGLCLLVLLMSNIALVNYAFDVGILALALQLLLTALYLLANDAPALLSIFWSHTGLAPASTSVLAPAIRKRIDVCRWLFVVIVAGSQVHAYRLSRDFMDRIPPIYGIWKVDRVRPEGARFADWKRLYFDQESTGRVRLSDESLQEFEYKVDVAKHSLSITRGEAKTALFIGSFQLDDSGKRLILSGGDSSRIELAFVH